VAWPSRPVRIGVASLARGMTSAGLIIGCGGLGLLVGSFVNVVALRVPVGESLGGRSRCPGCGHEIRGRDLVPVLSWLVLRGRCRDCGASIRWVYPAVEVLCAALFATLAAVVGEEPELPAYLILTAGLVALSLVDLATFRLPDRIVFPLTGLVVAAFGVAAAVDGDGERLLRALAAGAATTLVLGTLHLVAPAGMGFGDVKLSFVLGVALGWESWEAVAVGLFLACALGAVVGIAVGVIGGGGIRGRRIPFGPFLAAGTLLAVLVAAPIVDWYTGLGG
jgi:leader peptidase (prepilin peptidase)/N-methyltransferase